MITGSTSIYSAILGGNNNQIKQSQFGVILGGDGSKITHANHVLTAGNFSTVQSGHNGAFVLSDSRSAEYTSSGANTLNLRFQSGLFLDTDSGIFINGNPVVTGDNSSDVDTLQTVTSRGATTTNDITVADLLVQNDGQVRANGAGGLTLGNTNGGTIFVSGTSAKSVITPRVNHLYLQSNRDEDDIIFQAGEADVEMARFDSANQRLGVGTDNPQEKLHVYNAGTAVVEVEGTNGSGIFKATNSQGSYAWYVDEDNDSFRLHDFIDSADRIMITGNGNVSIATTEVAPHKLNVKGTISRLNSSNIQVVNLQTASEAGQVSVLNAGGTERVLLHSNGESFFNGGSVGIGTTDPDAPLHIKTSSNVNTLRVDSAYNEGAGAVATIKTTANGNVLSLESATTSDSREIFEVKNSNGAIFDILGNGNVGIGTSDPACILTVAGTISSKGLKGVSSINLEAAGPIITACSTNNASGLRVNVTGLDGDNDDLLRVQDNGNTRFCIERDGQIFGCSASLTGLSLADTYYACFGSGADLKIRHNGTDSSIANTQGHLYIQNEADNKSIIFRNDDGSGNVTEYFTIDGDNELLNHQKNTLNADSIYSYYGSGYDLSIWHDGTNSNIRNTTNDLYIANYQDAGDILIQTDDGTGGVANYLQFDGGGTLMRAYKNIRTQDDVFLQAGSSGDLELVHTADNSYINNKTGDLYITNSVDNQDVFLRTDNGSGGVCNYVQLDGDNISTNLLTTKVNMPNLPTSDPGVAGDLWRDGTDLKISVG